MIYLTFGIMFYAIAAMISLIVFICWLLIQGAVILFRALPRR